MSGCASEEEIERRVGDDAERRRGGEGRVLALDELEVLLLVVVL